MFAHTVKLVFLGKSTGTNHEQYQFTHVSLMFLDPSFQNLTFLGRGSWLTHLLTPVFSHKKS